MPNDEGTFHNDVLTALRAKLLEVSGLPPDDRRDWQNREFTLPPPPAEWVRYTFIPSNFEVACIAAPGASLMRGTGVFLVDWFFPAGGGMTAPMLAGGRVLKALNPRVVCSANGQAVIIKRSYVGRPVRDGAWMQVPVTVEWQADVVNSV